MYIRHTMRMALDTRKPIFKSQKWLRFDTITNRDSYFIAKCDKNILQNVSGFLLQNATVIKKCDDFIVKCESYFKVGSLWQKASVH